MARADITLTAVDQTRAAFDSVKRNLGDVERVAGSLSSTLAGLGAGLSAGALIGFVRSSIDAADNLGKLSQKVGVTVESLSELQYAGKLADVSTEQLGDGLRKLSVNLVAAADGSKEMQSAFAAVGISATELLGLKPDQALARIAEAFATTEDGANKTALAVKLLGRSGSDFIPLLNAGAAGLKSAGEEAKRFGVVVSTETARAAESFNDNMSRLGAVTNGFAQDLAERVLPTLTKFTEELIAGQRVFGSFGSALMAIGTSNPFASTAESIKTTREEVERLSKQLAGIPASGYRLRESIAGNLDTAKRRLEYFKEIQRIRIAPVDASMRDARDLALSPPKMRGTGDEKEKGRASGGGGGMRDGTDRIAALGAQMYLDQWADLAKQAKQIQDDLLTQFEDGNEAAARATKEQVDTLERILSGTKSGQERATFKDLEALNDALIVGRINAEEYEEAYVTIQDRLNEIRGVARETAADLSDSGTKALRDLQFAVEGWGRNFTNTLAETFETGKLQFGELIQSILGDLVRLQIQRSITKPLFDALSGALGSVNLFGGKAAPAGGGTGGNFVPYGGPKAAGGPVAGGTAYTVGERGPELFIPQGSGTIIPNGGAGGMRVTQVFNIAPGVDAGTIYRAASLGASMARSSIARDMRVGGAA